MSVPPSAASVRRRILGAFALHAITVGALATRLPDIQTRLGLDESTLGFALTVSAIGALVIYLFASKLEQRLGTRWLALGALSVAAVATAAMTLAPSIHWLYLLNFIFGAAATLANVAINVEADRVEAATGRRIMNRCHGVWSLTLFAVSLAGAGLRGAGVGQALHLWVHAGVTLVLLVLVFVPMQPQPPREAAGTANRARFAWPSLATLAIVAFGIGGDLLHGAANSWSIIYLRDTFDTSRLIEGLALPAFIFAMAASRLTADRWLDAYPARHVARAHLGLAILGVLAVVLAQEPLLALAGFALIGAGVGVVYPMMISAAARLGDRPAAENVAAMTLVVQILTLGAPLFVGAIAETWSLRVAFAAFLPLLLLGVAMARSVER